MTGCASLARVLVEQETGLRTGSHKRLDLPVASRLQVRRGVGLSGEDIRSARPVT